MKNRQTFIGIGIGVIGTLLIVLLFHLALHFSFHRSFLPFEQKRFPVPGGFIRGKFGHGIVGTIDSIKENSLTVKDKSGQIKQIITDDQTKIRNGRTPVTFSDLKKDLKVIIIGDPEASTSAIKAKVIQIGDK